jgi:hypothetical protein
MVYAEAAQTWDAISATRSELAQLRQVLDRIEALPEIGRIASIPLEAYDEYWERFYRPTPEVLSEQPGARYSRKWKADSTNLILKLHSTTLITV